MADEDDAISVDGEDELADVGKHLAATSKVLSEALRLVDVHIGMHIGDKPRSSEKQEAWRLAIGKEWRMKQALFEHSEYMLKTMYFEIISFQINLALNYFLVSGVIWDGGWYDHKKENAHLVNDCFRIYDAAIAHPETNDPCIIYAIASRDGRGRYTLENRVTKKRSGAYMLLAEIMPFTAVPYTPPTDNLIHWNPSGAGTGGSEE